MNGIRVSNIPATLRVQTLKCFFDSNNEGIIDKIYYPLLNNDAVIIFADEHAVAKILSRKEIHTGETRFDVKPLPHQIFSQISVLVEEEVASLVLATDEYKDTLIENGVKIFSTKSNGLGFKGHWFEVEWAWNYLHGILDRQYHIQEHLRQRTHASSSPVTQISNGWETTERNSVPRLEEPNPLLAKSVNASRHTSVRTRGSVADRIADKNVSSPRTVIGSSRDSTVSRSPSSALGAGSSHDSTISRSPSTLRAVGEDSTILRSPSSALGAVREDSTISRTPYSTLGAVGEDSNISRTPYSALGAVGEDSTILRTPSSALGAVGGRPEILTSLSNANPNDLNSEGTLGQMKITEPQYENHSSRDSPISKSHSSSLGAVGGHSEGTMRQTKVTEPQYENHSSQIRNPVTDSMTSLHSSNDVGHSPSDEPVVTLSDVSTRDRKHAARMSRSEDADNTFEYLASMRRNHSSGNDTVSSLLTQLRGLSTSRSSTDTEAKRSTPVSNEQEKSQHFTRYLLDTEAKESSTLSRIMNSQHTTRSSTDTRPKDTSASLHENVENQHSARFISDTGSSSKSKSLHRSMSLTDFQFTLLNEIEVSVYYGSLVKAKVDCIVNAANNALQHYSGVARAIEKAAGPELKDDCEAYIKRNTELPLTCVMHTRAGGQLKHLKYVIHTVGPVYYKKRQDSCIELLTRTFYNCIKYADEKIFMKSLALPFISTGMFDVPLECCVEAFLDAVVLFASEKREVLCLHKIHFVNTDADSVCTAIVMLQQHLEKPFSDLLKDAYAKRKAVLSSEPSSDRKSRQSERTSSARRTSSLSRLPASKNTEEQKGGENRQHRTQETTSNDRFNNSEKDYAKRTISSSHRDRSGSLNLDPRQLKTSKTNTSNQATRPASSSGVGKHKYFTDPTDVAKTMPYISNLTGGLAGDRKALHSTYSSSSPKSSKPVKAYHSSAFTDTSHYTERTTHEGTRKKTYSEENFLSLPSNLPSHHDDNNCPICLDEMDDPKRLPCGHTFCRHCIDKSFRQKPVCPQCGKLFGSLKGDQPKSGKMTSCIRRDLIIPGYESSKGAIEITYDFPPGTQEACHPHPGKRYSGIYRQAYLPNNAEGQEVLGMLEKAFKACLIFTIGQSRTTGAEDVLTWNDIHHKTSVYSSQFGYPDPGYLKRVKEELAVKGITQ